MNRNSLSHFDLAPQVDMKRSKFDGLSHCLKTSFNVGDLVPILCQEVLPGDEFSIDTSKVLRLQTLITPVMDNLWCDIYYFFVPNRLVWQHWQELMGENTDSAWVPSVEYSEPQIEAPSGGWNVGTIADYLGIPTGIDNISVSALPFRAYALICDQWFRDENVSQPLNIPLTDSTVTGVNTGSYVTDTAKGGLPFKAAKIRDYFSSCLPAPQKGADVPLPLGDIAPTFAANDVLTDFDFPKTASGKYQPLIMQQTTDDPDWVATTAHTYVAGYLSSTTSTGWKPINSSSGSGITNPVVSMYPVNLYTDLSQATATSINALRTAFQIQKLLERDARGGSRYVELLRSHFGVTSPDARLQRAEYLGGNRFPLNVQQVTQTGETGSTPLGALAGYSVTGDVHNDFTKGFTEHGFIIGLAVARYEHSYQQGIERFWSRTTRFDHYWPVFANLGEMAVKVKEIYATGTSTDDEVFGYQEAWADYRYRYNRVSGEMRSAATAALDNWHFADEYASQPYLSDDWIREDKTNIDRTLAVSSSVSNQIFGDFYFEIKATRPMPLYSIPGLIDHF